MLGRMKVRGMQAAIESRNGRLQATDEQTDDLQGFPRTLGDHAAVNGLNETAVFAKRANKYPPCTGYDKDYEEVERVYDDKPGY